MFDPLQIPNVWRAQSMCAPRGVVVPSGFAALDEGLGGGWPVPALIEVLIDEYGIGELQIFRSLLRELGRRSSSRSLLVWLNPPHLPNAVALNQYQIDAQHWIARALVERDVLWSMEQALRSEACAAVLAWSSQASAAALRRLKLSISGRSGVGIVFRPYSHAQQPSPASVRVALQSHRGTLHVTLLKVQGRKPSEFDLRVDDRQLLREAR